MQFYGLQIELQGGIYGQQKYASKLKLMQQKLHRKCFALLISRCCFFFL